MNLIKHSICSDGFNLTDGLEKKMISSEQKTECRWQKKLRYKFTVYYIDVTVIIIEKFKSTYLEKNTLKVHYVPY